MNCKNCKTDLLKTGITEKRSATEKEKCLFDEKTKTFVYERTDTDSGEVFEVVCSKCEKEITKEQSEYFYDNY